MIAPSYCLSISRVRNYRERDGLECMFAFVSCQLLRCKFEGVNQQKNNSWFEPPNANLELFPNLISNER